MRALQGIIRIAVTLLLCCAIKATAVEILVWDHDNNIVSPDHVFDEDLTVTGALTRTLDELDLEYTLRQNANLPDNLGDYDIVIIALGFYGDC
jgi:hypothetical protein